MYQIATKKVNYYFFSKIFGTRLISLKSWNVVPSTMFVEISVLTYSDIGNANKYRLLPPNDAAKCE